MAMFKLQTKKVFVVKVSFDDVLGSGGGKHNNVNSNTHASQHACSSLCDEVVVLWRLAALNPGLAPSERDMLHNQVKIKHWNIHIK